MAAGFGLWTTVCQPLEQTLIRAVRIHEKVLSSGLIIYVLESFSDFSVKNGLKEIILEQRDQ